MALLNITKSNLSGFPGISSRYTDPEGGGAPSNVIDGVYENGEAFSVDIGIQEVMLVGGGESTTYANATVTEVLSSNLPDGITISRYADKIRISGSPTNVFTDSFYQFIMKDKTLKILPANTTELFLSIVRWSPPSTKVIYDVPYVINFKYISPTTSVEMSSTITILQDVYWAYGPALAGFRSAVSKGVI